MLVLHVSNVDEWNIFPMKYSELIAIAPAILFLDVEFGKPLVRCVGRVS
jgi:hypothetical protein